MKICIADRNIPKDVKENLINEKYHLVLTCEIESLKAPLYTHPDIQICKINDEKIVAEPSVFDYYFNKLNNYGIMIEKGKGFLGEKYPSDCLYNLAADEKIAIHNFDVTDKIVIKNLYQKRIDVKQGYSKCNVCFANGCIITSDYGIYKKIPDDIKKLLIEKGDIKLKNYDYGFIGGATGFSEKLYFIGDLENYKEKEKIKEFLKRENIQYKSLGDGPLMDFGSLVFLKGEKE